MKSMTALTVLLISIWSQSQVSADQSTKLKLKPYDPLLEQEPNGLEQQLAKLVYVLDSFKDEWSRSNHEEILKSVMKIKPTISNLIKRNLKNCDIDALEHVVEDLVNTTVGFLTNVSGSVEAICNQVYQCANDGFPKSLGCFLELPQSCESYIQDIQEQLNEFLPKANKLALKIATDIVNCLP